MHAISRLLSVCRHLTAGSVQDKTELHICPRSKTHVGITTTSSPFHPISLQHRETRLTFIKELPKSVTVTSVQINNDRISCEFAAIINLPGNGLIPTVCCQDVMVPVRDKVAIILTALSLSLSFLADLKPVSQPRLRSAVCYTCPGE